MNLDKAISGLFDAEGQIRSKEGISNPILLSSQMMRMSAYVSAIEQTLAEYERDYEIQSGKILKRCMVDENMNASQSEKQVKIEIAETKGQIAYLGRLVSSAWKVVGVAQSRINHLIQESRTNI